MIITLAVETINKFEFELEECQLSFDYHYRYLKNETGDTVSFPELVAEFEIDTEKKELNVLLNQLDDFLMLTSFASRQRTVCLGWYILDFSTYTRSYRRSLTIPKAKKGHSFNEALITPNYFREFIHTTHEAFLNAEHKDLLRQAIYKAIFHEGHVESQFMSLYSGVETILVFFKKKYQLDPILSEGNNDSKWDKFSESIKSCIKKHPELSGNSNKERRNLIYEKLPELNKPSFRYIFNKFCEEYKVDLDDLWPIIDREEGISLTDIRNKIVHGDVFTRKQERSLISAYLHLEWIIERLILSVLGWSIEKSRVHKNFLSDKANEEWQKDREILSSAG